MLTLWCTSTYCIDSSAAPVLSLPEVSCFGADGGGSDGNGAGCGGGVRDAGGGDVDSLLLLVLRPLLPVSCLLLLLLCLCCCWCWLIVVHTIPVTAIDISMCGNGTTLSLYSSHKVFVMPASAFSFVHVELLMGCKVD